MSASECTKYEINYSPHNLFKITLSSTINVALHISNVSELIFASRVQQKAKKNIQTWKFSILILLPNEKIVHD